LHALIAAGQRQVCAQGNARPNKPVGWVRAGVCVQRKTKVFMAQLPAKCTRNVFARTRQVVGTAVRERCGEGTHGDNGDLQRRVPAVAIPWERLQGMGNAWYGKPVYVKWRQRKNGEAMKNRIAGW